LFTRSAAGITGNRTTESRDDEVLCESSRRICHSDVHYRAGVSSVDQLPLTLGHEVAGVVEASEECKTISGRRSRVHSLHGHVRGLRMVCERKRTICDTGAMIGKARDGGYAEFIAILARSVFQLPEQIPFEHGAIMMCSSATSLHALNKARMKPEIRRYFGAGGLAFPRFNSREL